MTRLMKPLCRGPAASPMQVPDGGQVYIRGQLTFSWDGADAAARRWTAVKLAELRAAPVREIASAFSITPGHVVAVGTFAGRGRDAGPGPR